MANKRRQRTGKRGERMLGVGLKQGYARPRGMESTLGGEIRYEGLSMVEEG